MVDSTVLESERLWLRALEVADGERIFELMNDIEIVHNLLMAQWP